MCRITILVTAFFYVFLCFVVQSQEVDSLGGVFSHKISSYTDKDVILELEADIDGDDKLDNIEIYTELIREGSGYTIATNLIYTLSKDIRKKYVYSNFLPRQNLLNKDAYDESEFKVASIDPIKNGIEVIIVNNRKKESEYKRKVTFRYDKKNATLVATKDGGIGVFGKSERYVNVKKFAKETITLENWNEWYSTFMCSTPTTLNNKIKVVQNENEFINAIGDNTTIILKTNKLDLSLDNVSRIPLRSKKYTHVRVGTISPDMGVAYADSLWWIEGVSNMSIIGQSSDLVSNKSKEYILWLNHCRNIEFSNISIYHDLATDDDGNGWNVCVSNSSDITIKYTLIKGFGGAGLFLYRSRTVNICQSSFENLTNFGLLARKSWGLNFSNCSFSKNQDTAINLQETFGEFNTCSFFDNTYSYLVFITDIDFTRNYVQFINCKEYNNTKRYDDSVKLGYSSYYSLGDYDCCKKLNSGNVILGTP